MATVVVEGEPEAEAPAVTEGAAEAIAEGAADVAEAQADAACEIAETQAERDVALAEIEQETRLGEAEIIAEAATDAELEQCRNRISELEASNSALETELASLKALSIPPTSEESPTPLPEPESVEPTLDSPEEAREPDAAEKPKPRKKFRWI